MDSHGIANTPQNMWIWQTYHSGANPELNRAIDILLSNGREFDDQTSAQIFAHFLESAHENEIIRRTTQRIIETLDTLLRSTRHMNKQTSASRKVLESLDGDSLGEMPLPALLGVLRRETETIEEQSRLLQAHLASSSSMIRQLQKTLQDAQREALTDALTGIPNRKLFDATMRQSVMEAMEAGADLSLLIMDIDHFKHFNDKWGHQTGDDVLKLVARTLKDNLRDGDTPARYGGEEFAAILPKAGIAEALGIAERLRAAIETRKLTERETGEDIGAITISAGAALFEPGESISSFIGRADVALYEAKHAGRNRVVAAPSGD